MTNSTFAVIIGVDNYTAYDSSGESNLRGAVNDANWWWRFCTRHLHLPPDNIKLLLAPGDPDASGFPVQAGSATRQDIVDALDWLKGKMTGSDTSGIFAFSGHGAGVQVGQSAVGESAAICPSDTRLLGSSIEGVLTMAEIQDQLGKKTLANVTFSIDACYTTSAAGGLGRSLTPHASLDTMHELVDGRLMLACAPWQASYELQARDAWHGAFTYSLLSLAEQWTVKHDGEGHAWLNVSYGDLVYRAHRMIDVLGVDQTPTLVGLPRVSLLPVFRAGLGLPPEGTSSNPDVTRPTSQVSAGSEDVRGYRLAIRDRFGTWRNVANCHVAGTSHTYSSSVSFQAGMEYWTLIGELDEDDVFENGVCTLQGIRMKLIYAGDWPSTAPLNPANATIQPVACSYSSGAPESSPNQSGIFRRKTQSTNTPNGIQVQLATPANDKTQLESVIWWREENNPGPWFSHLDVTGMDWFIYDLGSTDGLLYNDESV